MAKKRNETENHSVSVFAQYLEQNGYSSDRAVAASLDMLRRGTLPIVQPPKVSPQQKDQIKSINKSRRDVLERNRRRRLQQIRRLKKKLKKARG